MKYNTVSNMNSKTAYVARNKKIKSNKRMPA